MTDQQQTDQRGREIGIRYGSLTDEQLRHSYETEDQRWSRGHQVRDWIFFGLLCLVNLAWMAAVYFLEPGLR
jgi:hypothetical protein